METIKNYFFRDMGVMFGRFMRYILRSMDTRITVIIMPIAFMLLLVYVSFMLLFVYVFGGVIQTFEEIFL